MKEITLSQEEFIVLAHIMKSEKLMLYAGTGLQGKNFTQIVEDKNGEVANMLLQKGYVSLVGDEAIKNKVIFNRGIFILKKNNNYEYSNDVQSMKNIAEKLEYEIDILESNNEYSICVNKLIVSPEGYMSIIFEEDIKIFHIQVAGNKEKLDFFSKHLQIPLSYHINQEDSYIVSLKSNLFENLINAYTENDREGYKKLADQLGWDVEASRDFLKSTWENENYTNYVVINSKKKNEMSSIRIYCYLGKYFVLKTQNSKKMVEVALQDLSGMVEFFRP